MLLLIHSFSSFIEKSNYLCPRNEVLRSSKVNILGRYPTRRRTYHLIYKKDRVAFPEKSRLFRKCHTIFVSIVLGSLYLCMYELHWTAKWIYESLRVEQICSKFRSLNLNHICNDCKGNVNIHLCSGGKSVQI